MPETIPQVLAPYLHQTFDTDRALSLITSTLTTPAQWLLVRYLYAALHGVSNEPRPSRPATGDNNDQSACHKVVFVSILGSKDLWLELCKKVGLDLSALVKAKRLCYIDGLSGYNSQADKGFASAQLQTLTLENLFDTIRQYTTTTDITDTSTSSEYVAERTTIVIDGIDFILASQPGITTSMVQQTLSRLTTLCNSLVISCSADGPLLHNRDEAATPLEKKHAALVTTLAHHAIYVLQLRGLNTGAAKDVTGLLRISHGGNYQNDSQGIVNVDESEWLYQCKGDGNVRIWSRGD